MYNRYISEDTPYVLSGRPSTPKGADQQRNKGPWSGLHRGLQVFLSIFRKGGLGALYWAEKRGQEASFHLETAAGGLSGLMKALKLERHRPGGYPSAAYHPVSFGGRETIWDW